jgi:RNA polymerase sigma-70 factor (ECF subfamily)
VLLRRHLPVPAQLRVPPVVQLRRRPGAQGRRLTVDAAEELTVRQVVAAIEGERGRYVDFLRRRVGPDAEDVYQQSLLKAIERAGAVRDLSLARPWFWRVLRNAVADHHAARVSRDARLAALAASEAATPDEAAAACACALGLLPKLPAAYGEMLRRVDVDDERVVDVARDLGISADNAAVRLHRARKALRERLQGCCKASSMRACFECQCADEGHGLAPA